MALAVSQKLEIIQFDIKTAFLYGEIEEETYMEPLPGINTNENSVCRLKQSLYGLKQAPRCWNSRFTEFLKGIGIYQCQTEMCVYQGQYRDEHVILALYVDDGLVLAKKRDVLNHLLETLTSSFKIQVNQVIL